MVEPREARLRALKQYWDSMRGDRAMPARADLDPVEIPELLPYVLLVDTAETLADFRYRLVGTEVCTGFERDPTGTRFADLVRTEGLDEVYGDYWRTFRERTPQHFHGPLDSAEGPMQFSRLTLPLSRDGNHVDMILGGIVYSITP